MIDGIVTRQRSTPYGTPGHAIFTNNFHCDTLELPWADNERGMSCIVPDVYEGWVWYSPTFKRNCIRLEDKHGRKDCLWHNANFAATVADTDNNGILGADLDGDSVDEVFQLRGCTATGRGYGDVQRKDGKTQWGIKNSAVTLQALIDSLKDAMQEGGFHRVRITYRWDAGCQP